MVDYNPPYGAIKVALDLCRQACALIDCAFGIELRGHIGTADQMIGLV